MKALNYFATERGDAGTVERYKEAVAGFDIETITPEFVAERIADWVLARYDLRVRAFFRKAGIEIGDGELTVDAIREKVEAALQGLELQELSEDGIRAAVDKQLAAQLSIKLGMTISTVFDVETAKEEVKQQVLQALISGAGAGILKGKTLRKLRMAATIVATGENVKAALNRAHQRKYRKEHEQTWI